MTTSSRPTARAAAVIVLFVLAACSGSGNQLVDPTADKDLVLRVDTAGGFVPPEYTLSHIPSFSLYGDGRVIVEGPQIEIYPSPALPNVLIRDVTRDGIDTIMQAARDAGLSGPDRDYQLGTVADAGTTIFEVRGDDPHTTKVYALGFDDDPNLSEDERNARRRLSEFSNKLSDLQSWLPEGSVGEEQAYAATAVRVFVRAYDPQAVGDGVKQTPRDWPLAEQPLAGFGTEGDFARCGVVDGHDATTVLDEARQATQLTPWISEGKKFLVNFRPLLPDESGC